MAQPLRKAQFLLPLILLWVLSLHRVTVAFVYNLPSPHLERSTPLSSSFYEEPIDELDDDDDDDDDDDEIDDQSVANFRNRMSTLFADKDDDGPVDELIRFAIPIDDKPPEWANPVETITPGCVIIANPKFFCQEYDQIDTNSLEKYGLTMPPPQELGPDRRADLLPVLMLVEHSTTGSRGVLLNRRTGYLLGDLADADSGSSILEKFCIQPLWFGGIDRESAGIEMLHQCGAVKDATPIGDDLYWGGDPAQAQIAMDQDAGITGFDFKFFVQSTTYGPNELEDLIESNKLFMARVDPRVLFKSRDRMGTRRAKPLWSEIMELLGDDYQQVKDEFYGEDFTQDDYA